MALETYSTSFIGDGIQDEFDIEFPNANSTNILAIVNGLIQIPQVDYTVFSSVITFTNPPLSTSDIEVRYYTTDDTGSQGPQGPAGVRGDTGYNGSIGYSGSTGFTGSRGIVGYQGSKGIDAVNILFATSDPVTNTGFRGEQTLWWNPNAQVLYIYSGGAWNAVTTVGYKGSSGDRGPTGYLGSTGLTGFTGSTGIGYAGSAGTAAPRSAQRIISTGASSYTMNESVDAATSIIVSVNGLVQIPEIDYTVSGTTINFIDIPNDESDIEIKYFGLKPNVAGYRGSVGYRGSAGIAKAVFSSSSPSTPDAGQLWFDTDNGILNIYYEDEITWVGIAEGPEGVRGYTGSIGFQGELGYTGSMGAGYTGSASTAAGYTGSSGLGYTGSQGLTGYAGSGASGYTGSASTAAGYAGSKGESGFTGSKGSGYTGSQGITLNEPYISYTASTSTLVLDCTQTRVFYITPQSSFGVNLTNLNLPSNSVTNIVLMLNQGATARVPTTLQIDSSSKTIKWQGGSIPTPNASKTDMISFSILYDGTNYLVYGQLIPFG